MKHELVVYDDEALADYSFGDGHPFGRERYFSFYQKYIEQKLDQLTDHARAKTATKDQITLFHSEDYLKKLIRLSQSGEGFLDTGDTPAFTGIYEAASRVAGTTIDAIDRLMQKNNRRAFVPIAGLHHARRNTAAGFCALNDCGIAIEYLRSQYQLNNIAYVDIDAHHGDGVFYSFETDPDLSFADIHEDGIYLYPGTGFMNETGTEKALGTKLNIPMPRYADDKQFTQAWEKIETYLYKRKPAFIIFQCGADSLEGDPITQLNFSHRAHSHAARRLRTIADEFSEGRLLTLGGGGYNLKNIADAWCAVVKALV